MHIQKDAQSHHRLTAHQPAQMTVEFTRGLYTYNINNKIFEKGNKKEPT
jgi:hypothetical protein